MKRVLLLALAIIFLFSFVLAGCRAKTTVLPTVTDKPVAEKTTAPTVTDKPVAEKTTAPVASKSPEATKAVEKYMNPLVESIISDKYIDQMRCTKKDIDQILNTANLYGIKNPYIPVKGIATEYIMEVRKEQSEFAIIYPHFSITESTRDLIPIEYQERKDVKLTIGNATWVTVQGQERLFLKLNNIYISIHSAKPFIKKDFEKVVESLVQIIN